MKPVVYNGSLEGFFTAVFEIYEYKIDQPVICKNNEASGNLFSNMHQVNTNKEKMVRVVKKLQEKLPKNALAQLYKAFLSELKEVENTMFRYIQYVLNTKHGSANDYSNADVLSIVQISKKVDREKHRMKAFIRFQLTKDQLYYSIIQPDFNVLPLISEHFKKRYADQRWLIYDTRRKYGLYYDLQEVTEVEMNFEESLENAASIKIIQDESEELYQQLWRQYFGSVNIAARKNTRLHIRHVPKRYWRFLVEKQVAIGWGS